MVDGAHPAERYRAALVDFAARNNLAARIISSALLIPLAIAAAYFGGLVFVVFWAAAALGVLWEWDQVIGERDKSPIVAIGAGALLGATVLLAIGRTVTPVLLLVLGALAVVVLAPRARRHWCAAGTVYAGALLVASVLLRRDPAWGFAAVVFLFVVVWLTDSVAYFAGRAFGGPKLMPAVSPKKTWSGAIAGTVAAVLGGVLFAHLCGVVNLGAIAAIGLILSIVAQLGDLLESAVKRRFDVKDAGTLLPGHGGLMDRLDGFLTAVVAAFVIGVVHSGGEAESAARGLMVW